LVAEHLRNERIELVMNGGERDVLCGKRRKEKASEGKWRGHMSDPLSSTQEGCSVTALSDDGREGILPEVQQSQPKVTVTVTVTVQGSLPEVQQSQPKVMAEAMVEVKVMVKVRETILPEVQQLQPEPEPEPEP
jgi:hypothetical protein